MNWFKKVLKQIIKDNPNELDQVESYIEEKDSAPSNEWKKEIDSKVIYQYPKGKFRFPVIPDNTTEENRRENRQREFTKERNRPVSQTSNIERKQPQNEPVLKNTTPKENLNKIKKPFRLTETISPIYGYNRPVQKGKTQNNKEIVAPVKEYVASIQDKDKQEENFLLFEEEISAGLQIQDDVSLEREISKKVDEKQSFFDDEEADILVQTDPKNDFVITEEVQEEMEQSTDRLLEEAVEIEEAILQQDPTSTELTEEDSIVEIVEKENIMLSSNDVCDKKENCTNTEEIKPKGTSIKRGPLPFNVLMLNKDRQYMQKKKLEENSANKSIQQQSIEKRPVEIEEMDIPYYAFPAINLLHPPIMKVENDDWIQEQTSVLDDTFTNFNVQAKVVNVTQGPSVTRYEVQPAPGVKVSKITNLSDDLKLSLAAKDIRIEAPIPGKHTIGIEVPNHSSRPVLISEIINSAAFKESASPLTVALGLDIAGKPIVTDLRKMPHGLIAGATGSGKSVCINTMLVSLLYKSKPEELKLLLIDPKMVELAPYNYIPHLASPVITDVKAATAALKWAVEEMERRYELLAHSGVRDITKYNQLAEEHKRYSDKLPYIVIVIDELADLMMMAPADVEEAISRIAQKARACGIHLLIATQRPSVDVITGLIKANVPTRIAFSVSSQIDSRTVIDISGAEKLLGKGDMLFLENGTSKPVRLQGTFVSDEEIDDVVRHVRNEQKPEYLFEQEELLKKVQMTEEEDELFYEACEFIIEQGGASTSSLQRRFKIGYNRAARLIDMMEKQGFISEAKGTKPRDVLITEGEFLQMQENV
ncbi:DNA translocase FtsK [Niallia sp. 01092]|uniref:DNA translocase FtsK n=1 Tax=unclassified Niallia TaxID=2837522 RepID=UPI003FD58837